jgi:diguanylate cyclase (GGDEF)-like protein
MVPDPALFEVAQPPPDAIPAVQRPDARAPQLIRLIGGITVAGTVIGGLEAVAGAAYGEPRAIAIGLATVAYAGWLHRIARQLETSEREKVVKRIAGVTLGLIAAAAVLEPNVAPAMAIAALLPAVLVLPFLNGRGVGRILVIAGIVGLASVVAGQVVPSSSRLPTAVTGTLAFATLVLAYGFLMFFLWEVSRRLATTTDDLRSVVAMSNDLSRTMDPQQVGDRIVRHVGLAVGATESALCYWDRATDRLVTLGCYPIERRETLDPTYPLADYPATRRVLESAEPLVVDVADPLADQAEVAYVRSLGMRSMAIVPLLAAGTAIGTLELMSDRSEAFGPRDLELAATLAGESAMFLENARLYEAISHQALHDALTGLANRVLFRDRVANAIERGRDRHGRPIAILFIDLDDFKSLNDSLGHARGDEVLVVVARRVVEILRPSDTAARLGGDEFAVLLDDIGDATAAMSIANRLADALRAPMDLLDVPTRISASIGVALSGHDGETADDLLRDADLAMYSAKTSSRGHAQVYRAALRARSAQRRELAARLQGVAQRGELRLDYQPIIELESGAVVGLEALVRWQPPDRPMLMPGQFIDLAEETGEILPMGRWILREACRQARAWQVRLGLPALQMSVNLSARQFQEHDLVTWVGAVLAETGLPATSLVLEITENSLMQRTAGTIARLTELRTLGVHLAIDDFGTGYSSLSYLERFPVDTLKIDRSFIAGLRSTRERPAITKAIVELGRTLGLRVVAEGIEQPEQAEWLVSLGCGYAQGFLFSRPLGADAAEGFLAADASRRAQMKRVATSEGPPPDAADASRAPRRIDRPLRLVSGD